MLGDADSQNVDTTTVQKLGLTLNGTARFQGPAAGKYVTRNLAGEYRRDWPVYRYRRVAGQFFYQWRCRWRHD